MSSPLTAHCSLLARHALRFLLPWACAGCRTPLETPDDSGFCAWCRLELPWINGLICRFCGLPLPDGGSLCFPCRTQPVPLTIRAALLYAGPIRPAIHRLKYAGRKSLAVGLAGLMASAWTRFPELASAEILIPVPLHRSSESERGYNQARLLAEGLSQRLHLPLIGGLVRVWRTRPQFQLGKAERRRNLTDAFERASGIGPVLKGKHLLLIDDVSTTGATLTECARALKKARPVSIKAFVLARDP